VIVGFLIAWAEMKGWLLPAQEFSPIERITIYCVFFILALALQNITAANVQRLLRQTHESEAKYQSFLESIPTITYINSHGPEATTEYVSPQVANLLGYTQDEFLKDPVLWKKIIHPDDLERVLAENVSTVEIQAPFQMEYRLIAKDEKVVWVRDEAILVRDVRGAPQYWLGVWTDITTRKHAEQEQNELVGIMTKRTIQLQTAAEISRAVSSILDIDKLLSNVVDLIRNHFDYYYVGIFLLDESKTMAVLSAATGEMGRQMILNGHRLQVGDSSMIGWCIAHRQPRIALDVGEDAVRFKNPHLPLTRSEMALPLITRGTVIGAMTIQSAFAASFSRVDLTALQTMADQIANAIDNARLFAERSALIQELETRNTELERFTYTVSHDLRSPLVTIRGFLGYLRQDVTSGDLARFDKDIGRIANAVDKMQALLNDLLELSRIGRIITTPKEVPFREVVDESVNLLGGILDEHKVSLQIHEDLPTVYGDPTRLLEIMQNLINNAAKFMGNQPNPLIEIGTRGVDSDGKPVLFVRDNGMGIEPEYHERIFGLFNRLNPEIEGTGIGLTLVKRIVEVHGGHIWLESQPGQGATFLFTLPTPETK
jgi:PAS domain S-box-containing protein